MIILHDVVEETAAGKKQKKELINQFREVFGEEVLSVTLEVADNKSLSKKDRDHVQFGHIPSLLVKTRRLKLADKTIKLSDITGNHPVK